MSYIDVVKKIKSSVAFILTFNQEQQAVGSGSGFIFWKKGLLVTCNHVIKDAQTVLIRFPDSEFIPSKVVLRDEEHDLALMVFEDDSREPLKALDFKDIQEGMNVVFSGYPLGLQDLTTHQGILSAITKDAIGITTYLIDGTVNSGNSGCPLMDSEGSVIGVVNAKRQERADLIAKVRSMSLGAVSLHGIDMVEIYQALISNVQLGIGYAVPASYIPEHRALVPVVQEVLSASGEDAPKEYE